jgi:hypothetical protein
MFTRHLDQLAAQGVRILRVDVGWSSSQPNAAAPTMATTYNQRIDRVLAGAAARGMQVLLTLHQTPAWAASRPDLGVKQFPANPDAIAPWATWMGRTFGGRVAAWEIWNEPNLREFTGVDDPLERARRYVPLLRAASQALRSATPHPTIVFGGPAQTDDTFIRAAYAAGAQPYFDVMALHPYQGNQTQPPEATDLDSRARVTHFPAVIAAMAEYGDAAKPVWWTEFGYSTHTNAGIPTNEPWLFGVPDDTTSAEYLRRQFELARVRYPQVQVAIVYTAYKPPSDAAGHQYGYRLLEPDGTPRAQLPALRRYFASFG